MEKVCVNRDLLSVSWAAVMSETGMPSLAKAASTTQEVKNS